MKMKKLYEVDFRNIPWETREMLQDKKEMFKIFDYGSPFYTYAEGPEVALRNTIFRVYRQKAQKLGFSIEALDDEAWWFYNALESLTSSLVKEVKSSKKNKEAKPSKKYIQLEIFSE